MAGMRILFAAAGRAGRTAGDCAGFRAVPGVTVRVWHLLHHCISQLGEGSR